MKSNTKFHLTELTSVTQIAEIAGVKTYIKASRREQGS